MRTTEPYLALSLEHQHTLSSPYSSSKCGLFLSRDTLESPSVCWVTLGKLLSLSEPTSPHLSNGNFGLPGLFWRPGGALYAILGLHEGEVPPLPKPSIWLSSQDSQAAVELGDRVAHLGGPLYPQSHCREAGLPARPKSKTVPVGLSDILGPQWLGWQGWLLAKSCSSPEQGKPVPLPHSWASKGLQGVPTCLSLCDTSFKS